MSRAGRVVKRLGDLTKAGHSSPTHCRICCRRALSTSTVTQDAQPKKIKKRTVLQDDELPTHAGQSGRPPTLALPPTSSFVVQDETLKALPSRTSRSAPLDLNGVRKASQSLESFSKTPGVSSSTKLHDDALSQQGEISEGPTDPLPEPSKPKRRSPRKNVEEQSVDDESTSVARLDSDLEGSQGSLQPAKNSSTKKNSKSKDPSGVHPEVYSGMTREESAEFKIALDAGTVPFNEVAKVVFKNWKRFPGCITLTRVGNFYESYYEPAFEVSEMLGIKLARRRWRKFDGQWGLYAFCGFPVPQVDKYLKILVQNLGHTVVLVEEFDQEDPTKQAQTKARRVGRVVTPGTLIDESWLKGGESRYLLAISISSNRAPSSTRQEAEETMAFPISLAYTDVSTGEFFSKESSVAQLEDELTRIAPREVVLDDTLQMLWESGMGDPTGSDRGTAIELLALLRVLGMHVSFANMHQPAAVESLDGVPVLPAAVGSSTDLISLESQAISLLRHHLQYALRENMPSLATPDRQSGSAYMHIDAATLQALEIRHSIRPGGDELHRGSPLSRQGTLLSVLDETVTDAGHRLLVRALTAPSTSFQVIISRHALVQAFFDREDLRAEVRSILRNAKDVMRSVQRLKGRRGDADDMWATAVWIRTSERVIDRIKEELRLASVDAVKDDRPRESLQRMEELVSAWEELGELATVLENSMDEEWLSRGDRLEPDKEDLEDEESVQALGEAEGDAKRLSKSEAEEARERTEENGFWLKPSSSVELQDLYARLDEIKEAKGKMLRRLRTRYGKEVILSKFVRYGYYINTQKAPIATKMATSSAYRRAGESKTAILYPPWTALGIQRESVLASIAEQQNKRFKELRAQIVESSEIIHHNAELMNEIDLALSFAQTAVESGFVRPVMTEGTELHIVNGRHPTVEAALNASVRPFTPNSTIMSPGTHLQVITGPNQGGKSTLLRQTAVLAILAQAGSFVPADEAKIGIVDKVFSRVGARDDLFRDRSTFMLEMVETASILRYATHKSLVIMDEIGRGTTLEAGISIAYATLEYILDKIKCRTLFATHYHELGSMLVGGGIKHLTEGAKQTLPKETPSLAMDQYGRILQSKEGTQRDGVEFWCTDVDETDGAFSYSYRLKPGINFNSHAIKAARIAGMPKAFIQTATDMLSTLKGIDAESSVQKARSRLTSPIPSITQASHVQPPGIDIDDIIDDSTTRPTSVKSDSFPHHF